MSYWKQRMNTFSDCTRRLSRWVLCVLLCTLAAQAGAVTLKIATLSPDGSGWMKVLRKYAKNVEERTNGNVKFKFYPGGVMGDDKAVMRKMRVGQLHGAVVTSGGIMHAYPDIVIYGLPMMFQNAEEVDRVRAVMDQRLMQGLAQKKFIGFGLAEVGFAYPMTQSKASSVSQMRQQKVWTPDNDPGALAAFDAYSITPIPLPIADVLAGLQTGLINAIATPPIGAIALQWYTQVEHGLEVPLLYVYGLLTMAERPFKKLTKEEQAIVREELGKAVTEADGSARRDHESALAALTGQGIHWQTPSPTERQEWIDLAEEARSRLIANGYVSESLYREIESLLATIRNGG